jgi:hypothetical protein
VVSPGTFSLFAPTLTQGFADRGQGRILESGGWSMEINAGPPGGKTKCGAITLVITHARPREKENRKASKDS